MSESTPAGAPSSATTTNSESENEAKIAYAVGETSEEFATHLFPSYQVVACDGMPDTPAERLLLCLVLQYMTYGAALGVLQVAGSLVLPGGELHVIVPSADWAAREWLKPEPSPATEFILYGKQWQEGEVYHSGWTLGHLRTYMHRAGFVAREARALDATWTLKGPEGREQEVPVRLNYVVGVKMHEPPA